MFRGAENVFLNDMCYVYLVATPGLWYKGQVNGLGSPPLAPSKEGNQKNDNPWLPMTPTFYVKILSYYQNVDVYKKLDQKHSFCTIKIFCLSLNFKKNLISRSISKIFN